MTVKGYEASLDEEWRPLSKQHKMHLENLDEILTAYLARNTKIPSIAIVGPYGQGKTQLLFHIFKEVLKGGGVAVYTHADRIAKLIDANTDDAQKILPSDLPSLIKNTIWEELGNIQNSDTQKNVLLTDKYIIDYLKDRLPEEPENAPLVLLIDELEQAYQTLQDKIDTNDRNPIRSLLDPKTIYTVLAFAPRSIYEYELGATLGEGEAESSRLSIIFLPVLAPKELKTFLNIPTRGQANFIWWISRGRARYAVKAFQESHKYATNEPMGFQSFVNSMGKIGGVPCFDLDALINEKKQLLTNWKEVLEIVPSRIVKEEEWALIFSVNDEFIAKAINFFTKIGFPGRYAMVLSNHLALLLEAMSNDDDEAIIRKKDMVSLILATYELTLEHVYDEDLITILQKELDKLEANTDLRYSLPDIMEELGIVERKKIGRFLPFDLDKLLEFFPFPLSSPQLPGASSSEVEKWLGSLVDYPLAEDKESFVDLIFFKNPEHFKQYYESRKHKFCEQALPERKLTIAFFLYGETSFSDLPAAALWLRVQGRFEFRKIRPSLMANFLCNALFLLKPDSSQPRPPLRKELEILRKSFTEKGDRATARKIYHYHGALNEFIESNARTLRGSSQSFAYERKGYGFEDQYQRQKMSEAFPYPFTLAFFPEDTEGLRALALLRSLADGSGRPLYDYLPTAAGYRTAVGFLPTTDKKGVPRQSESVEGIRSFYEDKIDKLEGIVDSLSKEEFRMLVEDELSRFLLDAYYESRTFQTIGEGEKQRVLQYLRQALETHKKILEEEKSVKAGIRLGFDESLKFSSEQRNAIEELCTLVEGSDSWRSTVYQRIFFKFTEQCAVAIKYKADLFWKSLNQLPTHEYGKLKKLKALFLMPDQLPSEVFRFLKISRDEFKKQLKEMREKAWQEIRSVGNGLHEKNIREISNRFEKLVSVQEKLESIRNDITSIKEETLQKYRDLRVEKP